MEIDILTEHWYSYSTSTNKAFLFYLKSQLQRQKSTFKFLKVFSLNTALLSTQYSRSVQKSYMG